MGLKSDAVAQIYAQQCRHTDRRVIMEEGEHGRRVILALAQAHPLAQQRLAVLINGKQAAHRHGHFVRLELALGIVAIEHRQVAGVLVIGRLWLEMHTDPLGNDVQAFLNRRLAFQDAQQQMADPWAHAR